MIAETYSAITRLMYILALTALVLSLMGCAQPSTPLSSTPTAIDSPPAPSESVAEPAASPLPPGDYYVSVDGDDTASGAQDDPWRHIQYALDRVGPGTTIHVLDGIYNEAVTFPTSGSADAGPIILRSADGHAPVIDGTDLPIEGEMGLVVIENREYVQLIGFEIRHLKASGNPDVFPAGIWIRGNGAFIEIRDNRVHDIENSCEECGAHGIAVYGRDPAASIHDIVIDGNEVYNGKFGWSESVVLNGNVERFVVTSNKVYDNDNIGIDLIGHEGENPDPELDRARDGVVSDNLVYNIDTIDNPAYYGERSAGGIYVDGGTNIVIERNIVHNSNLGVELASEWSGKNTSFITLRNNFIYGNTQAGIAIGGYDEERGSTESCIIISNTLYNNATAGDWGAELYIQFDTRDNIIQNNIIFANEGRLFMESWSDVMTGNVIDFNLYFAPGGGSDGTWIWQGETYESFEAYREASGNDTSSLIGLNPLLVDAMAGDLHLAPGSPAIDAGPVLDRLETDIDGEERVSGALDIGADEAP